MGPLCLNGGGERGLVYLYWPTVQQSVATSIAAFFMLLSVVLRVLVHDGVLHCTSTFLFESSVRLLSALLWEVVVRSQRLKLSLSVNEKM